MLKRNILIIILFVLCFNFIIVFAEGEPITSPVPSETPVTVATDTYSQSDGNQTGIYENIETTTDELILENIIQIKKEIVYIKDLFNMIIVLGGAGYIVWICLKQLYRFM